MYYEAFCHNKDLDYIIVPMAGMTHPVINDPPNLSAELTIRAFQKFIQENPSSNLKLVCAIFKNEYAESKYKDRCERNAYGKCGYICIK